jgi:hypothetical protein
MRRPAISKEDAAVESQWLCSEVTFGTYPPRMQHVSSSRTSWSVTAGHSPSPPSSPPRPILGYQCLLEALRRCRLSSCVCVRPLHSSTSICRSSTSAASSSTTTSTSTHTATTSAIAPVFSSPVHATSSSAAVRLVLGLLFLHDVDDLVRHSEVFDLPNVSASARKSACVTYCTSANVDLG